MAYLYIRGYPDFKDGNGLWVKTKVISTTTRLVTLSFQRWNNLKGRMKPSYKEVNPTYNDIVNDFENYQDFVNWSVCQKGYSDPINQLDKDVLGGSSYSKENCVFIPSEINALFRKVEKRELPVGCYVCKRDNIIYANHSKNGKPERLGTFKTVEHARKAWLIERIDYLKTLISVYSGKLDDRVIESLKTLIETHKGELLYV